MKKLLALVLCVMMFVAVIPTAAFAEWPDAWKSAKAVSDAKANIDYLYGTLAADTTVFESIKSVDSILSNMAKSMFEGTDKYDIETRDGKGYYRLYNGDLVSNAKAVLRANIGAAITDYMDDHAGNFEKWTAVKVNGAPVFTYKDSAGTEITMKALSKADRAAASIPGFRTDLYDNVVYKSGNYYFIRSLDGKSWAVSNNGAAWTELNYKPQAIQEYQIDPAKYVDTFATAVSKAFTSKDGAAAIERIYYDLALAKLSADMQDKFDDLQDDIEAWEGTDALLAAYGFNAAGNWNPYAFINPDDLPKATDSYVGDVLAFDPATTPYFVND
jgi:hypothetical protein